MLCSVMLLFDYQKRIAKLCLGGSVLITFAKPARRLWPTERFYDSSAPGRGRNHESANVLICRLLVGGRKPPKSHPEIVL